MTTKRTTRYIPITPLNFHSEIRVDTSNSEVSLSVYNCDINHIDLLIMQLQALKAEHNKAVEEASEETSQMTAVLGKKPDPAEWYGKALTKNASKAGANIHAFHEEMKVKPEPAQLLTPKPPMPQPKFGQNIINVKGVATKQRKNYGGTKNPDMNADIYKGIWIRIYGISEQRQRWDAVNKRSVYYYEAYDRTFKMGDTVEYGSYNFAYTGKIVAIGEKTVKIEHSYGGKVTQLDLHTFIYRNWDLDLKKIAEDYQNWSMTS